MDFRLLSSFFFFFLFRQPLFFLAVHHYWVSARGGEQWSTCTSFIAVAKSDTGFSDDRK
jgi:hypothetical protein